MFNRIKCWIFGHVCTTPSIVNTLNPNNWLRKCDRCGRYVMHGDIGQVTISEKDAFDVKRKFEIAFPYSVKEKTNEY